MVKYIFTVLLIVLTTSVFSQTTDIDYLTRFSSSTKNKHYLPITGVQDTLSTTGNLRDTATALRALISAGGGSLSNIVMPSGFTVTGNGTATATISVTGSTSWQTLNPASNNTYTLGGSGIVWATLWANELRPSTSNPMTIRSGASTTALNFTLGTTTTVAQITGTNGNLILQSGGTFADNGINRKLQVHGTAYIYDSLVLGRTPAALANDSVLFKHSADSTVRAMGTTGTGNVVLSTSPALTTPNIGAASGTSLNLSGLTASQAVVTDGSKNLTSLAYSSTATASNLVQRDGNANVFANNFIPNLTTTVSAGGTTNITPSSSRYQTLTGTSSQTYKLPNAQSSGMAVGATFEFNNNSTGTLTVTDFGGSTIITVSPGGWARIIATDVSTTNGVWDVHSYLPTVINAGTAGMTFNDGVNIIAGTSTGMKIGTATTQKLGFFNATPIVQPSGSVVTALNNLGLVSSGTLTSTDVRGGAYTFAANNTNATANYTENTFRDNGTQTYAGTITWTGTTAPSGTINQTYHWVQVGHQVTLTISINYSVAGSALTVVTCTLPADCPNPSNPTGTGAANTKVYTGFGYIDAALTGNPPSTRVVLAENSGANGWVLSGVAASQNAICAQLTVVYFTN